MGQIRMAFLWNKFNVEMATFLSRKGFSAREAAEVIGTTRSSVLGRSRRMGEFHFSKPSGGIPPTEEEFRARVQEAKLVVAHIEKTPEPKTTRPINTGEGFGFPEGRKIRARKLRKNQPTLDRREKTVERPLSASDKAMIFQVEGPNESSVDFLNMKEKSCRWIVSEIDGLDTMACGRARIEGSPYCHHHHERSVRRLGRPKKQETANTDPKAVTRSTVSSLPRKSCVVTESSSS